MSRRIMAIGVLMISLLGGLAPSVAAADSTLPLPAIMAAVGDSITQAASTNGSLGVDAPENSWSTGTNTTVNSHYLRLLAAGAPISGQNNNLSVSGAKVGGLDAQMQTVIPLQPNYLTVLIGGNDLCTDTVVQMTSVTDFRAQFQSAMATLTSGSSSTNVYVISIPDVYQLWNLFHNNWWARTVWAFGGVCQSLLANPTSTQSADVQRRAAVRQRNIDYNTQLAEICALFSHCRFDSNAVFNVQFATSDVSGDYFHPSIAGQAKLASVTWAAGYTWTSTPPTNLPPTASFTSSCTDLTCTFTNTSSDPDGTIASSSWGFGDGGTSTATSPTYTYASGGSYTVSLSVTDNSGAAASTSSGVNVSSPPVVQAMWVDSLSSTTKATRRSWTATVTIHVTGASGSVSGVAVSGTWSAGTGGQSCTTGTNGSCSLKSSSLANTVLSVTFSVGGLTKSGWTYDQTQNVATSVVIAKP